MKKLKTIRYYLSLFVIVGSIFLTGCANTDSNISSDNSKETQTQSVEELTVDKNSAENENSSSEFMNQEGEETTGTESISEKDKIAGYRLIEVDGGDLSGHREPNVVVDIGFGDREYWAYTNEFGQLVRVEAKEVILQDDSKELVNSKGRYYNDEARVPGTERKDLDQGHVIADSLGGVSNAYNITPQNSTLNRHGDQAYMEKAIRDAGGCTDFVAIITYPNTTTQIPSHYSYTYTINGRVINDEFDNVNPDEYNSKLGLTGDNKNTTNKNNNTVNTTNNGTNNGTQVEASDSSTVYWTPNGKSYHTTKSCPTLSRSKNILEGTIKSSGKDDPCDRCH